MFHFCHICDSRKSRNWCPISFRSLFWLDLGLLTFLENSNDGRENYWKSGVQIPALEDNSFFLIPSFHFQNLHTIVDIFYFNHFLISCLINKISNKTCWKSLFLLYWYLICKTRCSKIAKNKDMQFFMENLKMKRKKGQTNFDLSERGFEPQIFSNFPAPWFDFSCEVRSPRSNQNKLLKEIGLYLKPHPPDWWPRF